ncbi:MAG: anti-sigma factor RsbA family regulatory protein [Pseudonocardiaceae bacterium]
MTADLRSVGASAGNASTGFAHRLLFYTAAEEFLATTLPFLQCGLAHDDALLVVTSEANIGLLRDALGGNADLVDFADAVDWYRNPARTFAAYGGYLDEHPDQCVRIICEPIWHDRTEAEIREWTQYESMCNAVFADSPVLSICPYYVLGLRAEILVNALRTHPEQVIGTTSFPNHAYTEPAELAAEYHQEDLPEPPASATTICFGQHDPATLRHLIAEHAYRAGMETQRIAELVLLMNEAPYNAVEHGGNQGTPRIWCRAYHLAGDVISPAAWPGGPFAGYMRRLARRWSRPARAWPTPRRRGGGAGWDWPG